MDWTAVRQTRDRIDKRFLLLWAEACIQKRVRVAVCVCLPALLFARVVAASRSRAVDRIETKLGRTFADDIAATTAITPAAASGTAARYHGSEQALETGMRRHESRESKHRRFSEP